MIFDVLGDPVNLVLGFMDLDLGICARNGIDLSVLFFFLEDGSLSNANGQLARTILTLSWSDCVCGDSSFYLNLLFSIISSKSMSTFLPLWALRTFLSSFSRLASSIFILRSSLFFYIFLISSKCVPFLSPPLII